MCLKALSAAREETKLVRVETSENSKPQFIVNISSFKGTESPVEAVEVAEAVERTTRHLPSAAAS